MKTTNLKDPIRGDKLDQVTGLLPREPLDLASFEGHTPGPWTQDPEGEDAVSVEGADGTVVCDVHGASDDPLCEANCNLIAAAPALLAECKRLANESQDYQRRYKEQVNDKHRIATEYEEQAKNQREELDEVINLSHNNYEKLATAREEIARLRKALEELAVRCDGPEGVRADGSNIQTIAAHAALGDFEEAQP